MARGLQRRVEGGLEERVREKCALFVELLRREEGEVDGIVQRLCMSLVGLGMLETDFQVGFLWKREISC